MRWLGSAARQRGNEPLWGVVDGARQRRGAVEEVSRSRSARVEAFEADIERLGCQLVEGRGEGLVDRVVADHPRVVLERRCHRRPGPVVLALDVAHEVVSPEVAHRSVERRRRVVVGPASRQRLDRQSIGTHRPRRGPFTAKARAVDVLVHVQERVYVVASQNVDGLLHLGQILVGDRLVPLMRIAGRPQCADGGVVGSLDRARLDPGPDDAQSHDVEPEPGDGRRIFAREVPGLARVDIELVGRSLVDGVHPVQDDHPAVLVVDRPALGAREQPMDIRRRGRDAARRRRRRHRRRARPRHERRRRYRKGRTDPCPPVST